MFAPWWLRGEQISSVANRVRLTWITYVQVDWSWITLVSGLTCASLASIASSLRRYPQTCIVAPSDVSCARRDDLTVVRKLRSLIGYTLKGFKGRVEAFYLYIDAEIGWRSPAMTLAVSSDASPPWRKAI